MLKKLALLGLFGALAPACYAEDMDMVTVFSSSVGSFAKLETADASKQTEVQGKVSFCRNADATGDITLEGKKQPIYQDIKLEEGSELVTDATNMFFKGTIGVGDTGRLEGRAVSAELMNVTAEQARMRMEELRSLNPLQAQTVRIQRKLNVNAGRIYADLNPTFGGRKLIWSNKYQTHPAYVEGFQLSLSNQFLLKGVGKEYTVHPTPDPLSPVDPGSGGEEPSIPFNPNGPINP